MAIKFYAAAQGYTLGVIGNGYEAVIDHNQGRPRACVRRCAATPAEAEKAWERAFYLTTCKNHHDSEGMERDIWAHIAANPADGGTRYQHPDAQLRAFVGE